MNAFARPPADVARLSSESLNLLRQGFATAANVLAGNLGASLALTAFDAEAKPPLEWLDALPKALLAVRLPKQGGEREAGFLLLEKDQAARLAGAAHGDDGRQDDFGPLASALRDAFEAAAAAWRDAPGDEVWGEPVLVPGPPEQRLALQAAFGNDAAFCCRAELGGEGISPVGIFAAFPAAILEPSARPPAPRGDPSAKTHAVSAPHFESFSGASGPAPPGTLELVLDIPLHVTVELGRTEMLVKDILELGVGSVVELDKASGEPVDVIVGGRLVAQGEVVVIDENFGVRITKVLGPLSHPGEDKGADGR